MQPGSANLQALASRLASRQRECRRFGEKVLASKVLESCCCDERTRQPHLRDRPRQHGNGASRCRGRRLVVDSRLEPRLLQSGLAVGPTPDLAQRKHDMPTLGQQRHDGFAATHKSSLLAPLLFRSSTSGGKRGPLFFGRYSPWERPRCLLDRSAPCLKRASEL